MTPFGLPDLYDMSGGGWGGDGESPERPSHLSVWAKDFLGWINLELIASTVIDQAVGDLHASRKAYRINVSNSIYYLVDKMQRSGFDLKLYGDGLQIWKVNSRTIDAKMRNNTVNADPTNRGVELVEADGLRQLDRKGLSATGR